MRAPVTIAALIAASLFFNLPDVDAATVVQTTADNWVQANSPGTSNSGSGHLALRGTVGEGDAKEAFIEFQVPDFQFDTAQLNLEGWNYGGLNVPNQLEVSIVPVVVDVNSLTWNTRPLYGSVLATVNAQNGPLSVSLPPDSLPPGETIVLRLRLNLDGWGNFESLESGSMIPELELDGPAFIDVTPPALQIGLYGAGAAWGDYDNDGDEDVYVVGEGGGHRLVRNDGSGNFTDVTPGLLTDFNAGWAAVWGDYDSDGDLDLFRAGYPNKLFNNQGGGVFADSSGSLGSSTDGRSAAWADFDGDGDLDLFVAGGDSSNYYRNDGNGFTDATSGGLSGTGTGWGTVASDYDNDGDVDIYVINSSDPERLIRNEGNGVFTSVANPLFSCCGSYGVAWGDYDNDGDFDLYQGNTSSGPNKLFHNNGGTFADSTNAPLDDVDVTPGVAWGDYDNDGDLDLYLAILGGAFAPNKLLGNNGDRTFTDVTVSPLDDPSTSREATWCDYDGDGDLDLYIVNFIDANVLLQNNLPPGNHWLQVDLAGEAPNLNGIGAVIRVVAGGVGQIRQVVAGSSARGQEPFTASFGLGTATSVDTVECRWPSGAVQYVTGVAVDQRITLTETTVDVTVTTDPPGLDVAVDNLPYTAPRQFVTFLGNQHNIGVSSPQVHGDSNFVFSGWSDGGAIAHNVTPTTDTTYTASFNLYFSYPVIEAISDVPNDQGGWARVRFTRSLYDDAAEDSIPVANYGVHRRVDDPALVAHVMETGKSVTGADGIKRYRMGDRTFISVPGSTGAAPSGTWEVLGSVPASQEEEYIYLAPTLADSSSMFPYSVYYVSAHTTTPSIFFDSAPDSGYSLDNIAPGVPQNLALVGNTGSGNQLTWDPAPEPDFQYYKIYRDADPGFVPGMANLAHTTTTPSWTDPDYDGGPVHYKVSVVDHAGNESDAAYPNPISDTPPSVPDRFALYQNVPNPFNPSTAIAYDVPPGGGEVTLRIYDVAGRLVREFVDDVGTPGHRKLVWDGRNRAGRTVTSGIYFCRLSAPGFTQTRKMLLLK